MGKYVVISGQNIYDVALHLYGSIEGVIDLLMNNPLLSFEATLRPGDELIYTDGFVINADVLNYNRMHGIVPANGERNVYPKTVPKHLDTLNIELVVSHEENSSGFVFGGNGEIAVDWGDNSPIETIRLNYAPRYYHHSFDNKVPKPRTIRVYNGNTILEADFSLTKAQHIYCLEPIAIEKLTLNNGESSLEFVSNLPDMYSIDLTGHKIGSLLPLLANKKLMEVDLTDIDIYRQALDDYLISLVKKHYGRRNCEITMSEPPSGEYREPERDEDLNYVIESGMEAIWLITHEESWNDAGAWKFIIEGVCYTVPEEPMPDDPVI